MQKDILEVLKQYWGYSAFRPLQEDIIRSVLEGRDTLALMPTGGGKSICFQVPAMAKEGICIVVSPLIALMKDQVENLKARGIEAIAIYSGMPKREVDWALDSCIYGPIKFLYLSPERLKSDMVRERLRHMNVNLFAIDEAHCISQWGYDFRPPYLELSKLREIHPDVPFLALTATATPDVVEDIQEKLGFRASNVLKKSFYRENLAYMVIHEEDKQHRMLRIIQKLGGSGIVYVRNRRETQETARFLINSGISADFYHAGLVAEDRMLKQDQWKTGLTRVIVATNAFGMGIDKPDVRFVIHLDPPDTLEAYYQEAGRAGRDGKKSHAILLFQDADLMQLRKQFEDSFPPLAFIQKVYQQLGNFYQLAYGAGELLTLDFDLGAFCQRYQLSPVAVLHALKFLERDGWVYLTESVYLPARIKFELPPDELYKFQVENQQHDRFIKLILRSFGGAFNHYIAIREHDIAKKMGVPVSTVIDHLKHLHQLQVLDYISSTDSPQIQFLQPRVDLQHLYIDTQSINIRKKIKSSKLQAVIDYLQFPTCRSHQLLAYFDEPNAENCGVCDVCIRAQRKQTSVSHWYEAIKKGLEKGPMAIKDLVDVMEKGDEEERIQYLRKCLDEGIVKVDKELYYWAK
jgi:ATP-dependent DNA helicase RecQ